MPKFYYTYKITLLKGSLAGHYYLGRHSTNNLNDGYAGSGKKITDYFKKYPKIEHQTYIKEIIAFYDNDEDLNEAEKQLIGDKFLNDDLCLNLCEGGSWGRLSKESCKKISKALTGKHPNEVTRKKISESGIGNKNALGHKASLEAKEKLRISHLGNKNHLGCKHSDEAKEKMRNKKLGTHWKKDPETGKRIYYKNIA